MKEYPLFDLHEDLHLDVLEKATWYPQHKPADYVNLAIDLMKVRIKKFEYKPSTSGKVYADKEMTFGKYSGFPFEAMPTHYIGWMLENTGMKKSVYNAFLKEMLERIDDKKYVLSTEKTELVNE